MPSIPVPDIPYNSTLVVSLSALEENYRRLQQSLGQGVLLIPVLKANAYGLGAVPVAQRLHAAGAGMVALAQLSEAAALRETGPEGLDILLLGALPPQMVPAALALRVQPTLHSPEAARLWGAALRVAGCTDYPVHLKIETGLNRIGARPGEELQALAREVQAQGNMRIAGAYTHFADTEHAGSPLAARQLACFREGIGQLAAMGIQVPLQHAAASAATEWYPDALCNAVRIGRRLYMDAPQFPGAPPPTGLVREVATWKSTVVSVRHMQAGEAAGYGERFVAQKPMELAVVCVGYADGLEPGLAKNGAPVLLNGQRATLVGCCMDQCFVDATGIPCAPGDEVVFFGTAQNGAFLSAQEVAAHIDDEGVYLTTRLLGRVKREYLPNLQARKTTAADVGRVAEILEDARAFLRDQGLDQWQNGYPNADSVRQDIANGNAYVLEADGRVVGTAALCFGEDATYANIYEGSWRTEGPYAAIHRVAVDSGVRGAGLASQLLRALTDICLASGISCVRIDTHRRNLPMQRLLEKNGFSRRGIIYLADGAERIAFDKLLDCE